MMKKMYQVERMIIEENEEKIGWNQRAFEREQKSTNGIENKNDMTRIHKK